MDRINFQNNVTKLDKEMFDTFQNNVEKSAVVVSTTQPTTSEKVWFKKGKNKFNSDKLSSQTNTGITTSFDSSTMKLNGTSTGDGSIYNRTLTSIVLEAGTYTWTLIKKSGTVTKTTQQAAAYLRKSIIGTTLAINSLSNFATSDSQKITFTLTEETAIEFSSYVNSAGISFNNLILQVQIEKGSGSAYEEYVKPEIFVKNNDIFENFGAELLSNQFKLVDRNNSTNYNDFKASGFYQCNFQNGTNAPNAYATGMLLVLASYYIVQLLISQVNNVMHVYTRISVDKGSTWLDWKEL